MRKYLLFGTIIFLLIALSGCDSPAAGPSSTSGPSSNLEPPTSSDDFCIERDSIADYHYSSDNPVLDFEPEDIEITQEKIAGNKCKLTVKSDRVLELTEGVTDTIVYTYYEVKEGYNSDDIIVNIATLDGQILVSSEEIESLENDDEFNWDLESYVSYLLSAKLAGITATEENMIRDWCRPLLKADAPANDGSDVFSIPVEAGVQPDGRCSFIWYGEDGKKSVEEYYDRNTRTFTHTSSEEDFTTFFK
ncbi:MAG: hypothetical protein ABIH20_02785 [Candidatus Diapherotrites archaeon]